jgi:flavin reductase (DIM6/NTAB) family NADH-FMN oxidoreductase RutF/DNA-binding FadR family transcriptional regulator
VLRNVVSVHTPTPLTSDQFRDFVGRFASGVTVITTSRDNVRHGATASAVSSLSLDPPMLLICMNRAAATGRAISEVGQFAVNVLGEDQSDLAVRFASPTPDRFAGVRVSEGLGGTPVLADALATFECRVVETVIGGTHYVFLAEVERASGRAGAPLAYFRGQFGRLELEQDASAAREVRERVLHRRLPIGEPIDLDRLADELQTPRGSLYHALSKLLGEGLVERDESGCFVVPPVTLESLLESARARVAIFVGAAVQALAVASEDDLAEVRRLLERVRAAAGPPFVFETWFRARSALVEGLVGLTGANVLLDAFDRADVPAQILSLWSGARAPDSDELGEIRRGYTQIVEVCETGELGQLPAIVRRLLGSYDRMYHRSFSQASSI